MKKAKLQYTDKGYSYIKCTKEDCFNWGGISICDNCGRDMDNDVYLIFILGSALCPKCFENWAKNSKKYADDLKLQKQRHKEWYKAYGFIV